jgi:hypothetical protein
MRERIAVSHDLTTHRHQLFRFFHIFIRPYLYLFSQVVLDRSAIDISGLGEALAAVIHSTRNVVHPAHDAADDWMIVPVDVSHRWLTPDEAGVPVRAHQ